VWSPNGTYIASAGQDATVQLWHTDTGSTIYTYRGHTQPIKALAWSPDGVCIASGSDDTTVQVWHAKTGERVTAYDGHRAWIRTVAWSPDGQYIASASDARVHVWRPFTRPAVALQSLPI
jgi:WD40 repeat protein